MAILTFPASSLPSVASLSWHLRHNTQNFRSPLDGTIQTAVLPGAYWRCVISYDLLTLTQARILSAFFAELEGAGGRFYFSPPHLATARGIATGTPLVNGASQTGSSIITDGWTNSTTNILRKGDLISWNTSAGRELHEVIADVNSGATTGPATISIKPPIRVSPADNAAITVASPSGVFALEDDEVGSYDVRPGPFASITIAMREAYAV
jgi:hypothetical protein